MQENKQKRLLLAHDSFTQEGGAERVFSLLGKMFPGADVYVLLRDKRMAKYASQFKHIITSPLQVLYKFFPKFKYYLPLIPLGMWASREVRGYDVILSSSSLFLKALRKKPGAVHIQYCHTPPRFLWTERDYASREVPKVLQFLAFPYLRWMKGWDVRMSNRVDIFIANSREVQKRIREFYGRDSVVVYPFVNTSFWKPTKPKGGYFLMAGRLVSHKRFELVVEAFNQLGLPLYVAGRGRIEGKLRSIAKSNIIFKGRVNDEELRDLYSGAIAYLYPQFEDAGIMPLEAAACGTPTIAADQGGSKETVLHGVTGMRVAEVSVLSLVQAVKEITSQAFEQEKMIRHAHGFSEEKFKEQLLHVVNVYL